MSKNPMNQGLRPTAAVIPARRRRRTGQVAVIFGGAIFAIFLLMALVIDLSWYWANSLKVQRAADAGSLAGVVWLPGDPASASTTAIAAAKRNGYDAALAGITVTPTVDPADNKRLYVTVTAPVQTFFMRLVGIPSITASYKSHAEYVLPVPMGSPDAWYGDFGLVRGQTTTSSGGVTTTLPDANLEGPSPFSPCPGAVLPANTCFIQSATVALNPGGFWGTMNTEGAANINGDAYMPYYDTNTSAISPACNTITTVRACYDATNYYNYAIEMAPGSTNGAVYIFDPVFCATATNKGTADRWFSGNNGVSSYFELYNTNNQIFVNSAPPQTLLASSGTLFQQIAASDSTMGGSGGSECRTLTTGIYNNGIKPDGRDFHDKWYRLYTGLTGGANGTIYRLHTTTTDPSNVAQQRNTDGENSFAVYASASGTAPKVYGLGAMQMFTPLSASGGGSVSSEFYLAQIGAEHAGKTVEVSLWDPGDTSPLTASIQVELPSATVGVWTGATNMSYSAVTGTTNSAAVNCSPTVIPNVSSIVTANPNSHFNGCWLTIDVPIPPGYTAPQSGWWKIKYTMSGSGTSNDVTTWKVGIKGNPVHLITP
jgi:hypothetical protein